MKTPPITFEVLKGDETLALIFWNHAEEMTLNVVWLGKVHEPAMRPVLNLKRWALQMVEEPDLGPVTFAGYTLARKTK